MVNGKRAGGLGRCGAFENTIGQRALRFRFRCGTRNVCELPRDFATFAAGADIYPRKGTITSSRTLTGSHEAGGNATVVQSTHRPRICS